MLIFVSRELDPLLPIPAKFASIGFADVNRESLPRGSFDLQEPFENALSRQVE